MVYPTGAGPGIRDYPIETNLLFSWNFLIFMEFRKVVGKAICGCGFWRNSGRFEHSFGMGEAFLESSPREILVRIHGSTLHDRYVTAL